LDAPERKQPRLSSPPPLELSSTISRDPVTPDAEHQESRLVDGFPDNTEAATAMPICPKTPLSHIKTLVDYVLPEGADRTEWDTDFLRQAFGEIEIED
jgi:hypothetical protein